MRFVTHNAIPLPDLVAMANGTLENTINDVDFLETLARQNCILVPPWVVQTSLIGKITQVTPLVYTMDGELDKPRILIAVARYLHNQRFDNPFRRRFGI